MRPPVAWVLPVSVRCQIRDDDSTYKDELRINEKG